MDRRLLGVSLLAGAVVMLLLASFAVSQQSVGEATRKGMWQSIKDRAARLMGSRSQPAPAPEDLDHVADIYRKAAEDARGQIHKIREDLQGKWKDARHEIADIYEQAATKAQKEVDLLHRRARDFKSHDRPSREEAVALEEMARHIHEIYRESAQKAHDRALKLEQRVDESWQEFRRRIEREHDEANRQAEIEMQQLRDMLTKAPQPDLLGPEHLADSMPTTRYAEELAERTRASEGFGERLRRPAQYVKEKLTSAYHGTKEGLEHAAERTADAWDTTKNKISDIYRNTANAARSKVAALKGGTSDTIESMQRKIQEIYDDAAHSAESQVRGLRDSGSASKGILSRAYDAASSGAETLRHKASELYDSMSPSQWYQQAKDAAHRRVTSYQQPPRGTTWEQIKNTIGGFFEESQEHANERVAKLRRELEEAEKHKYELDRSRRQARSLPEIPGEAWEATKARIAEVYYPMAEGASRATQKTGNALTRAWQTVRSMFGGRQEHGEGRARSISSIFHETADKAKNEVDNIEDRWGAMNRLPKSVS